MAWVATAIVGTAAVSAYSSNQASNAQQDASNQATAAQLQATKESNELQWKMFEQNRADQEPWRQAGQKALQIIQETPDFNFSQSDFFDDPSYQFRMDQGVKALDRSAAASGNIRSGAQDKALLNYGQNLASTEYGNAFNRALTTYNTNMSKQQSLAGIGQSATNAVASMGQNTANNISNNTMSSTNSINALNQNAANAQAQNYTNMANIGNQAVGNYLLYSSLQ